MLYMEIVNYQTNEDGHCKHFCDKKIILYFGVSIWIFFLSKNYYKFALLLPRADLEIFRIESKVDRK